ncbi:hypothetical protein LJC17_05235 [Acholeplasma sp. OttesenSCG-928-E16]|nr:hypothetical protein [Acholeplasma sp. OttesenSCG-928-E16]
MKKNLLGIVFVFLAITVIAGCSSPNDALGVYNSSNNGSIEITYFDGEEGDFTASNLVLPRLHNGQSYYTANGDYEIFAVTNKNGNTYNIRFSVSGVAYIGVFNSSNMSITVEGITYTMV